MPPRTPTLSEQIGAEPHRSRALRIGAVDGWPTPFRAEVWRRTVLAESSEFPWSGHEGDRVTERVWCMTSPLKGEPHDGHECWLVGQGTG